MDWDGNASRDGNCARHVLRQMRDARAKAQGPPAAAGRQPGNALDAHITTAGTDRAAIR
jgi:hypothetical protein